MVLTICHCGVVAGAFSHVCNAGHNQHAGAETRNMALARVQHTNYTGGERWRLRYHNPVTIGWGCGGGA